MAKRNQLKLFGLTTSLQATICILKRQFNHGISDIHRAL